MNYEHTHLTENVPTCDECGVRDEEADYWCGNCGMCGDHCHGWEGCYSSPEQEYANYINSDSYINYLNG